MGLHIMFLWNYFWCNKQSWIDVLQDTLEKAVKYFIHYIQDRQQQSTVHLMVPVSCSKGETACGLALNASIMLLLFIYFENNLKL